MVADGSISENAGDSMKEPWYSELTFYPWFQRIQAQYERILSDGGVFIYDTGYLFLFGQMDDDFLINLLLISLCFSFSFANVMAMEENGLSYKNGLYVELPARELRCSPGFSVVYRFHRSIPWGKFGQESRVFLNTRAFLSVCRFYCFFYWLSLVK